MIIFDFFKKKASARQEASSLVDGAGIPASVTTAEPQPENTQSAQPAKAPKRIHNLIILDESGSMMMIYRPALAGVNKTLQTIRESLHENPGQEQLVTLVSFDSDHYNVIYANVPAEQTVDITVEQYRPSGGTPLYDAMGHGITVLREKVEEGDGVLVTIITDGEENSSRCYTGFAIKALVTEMRQKGWVFTYIGANQDVEAVAESLAINNSLEFQADEQGTRDMFEKEMRCRKMFYARMSCSESCSAPSDGYFDEGEVD